MARAEQRLGGLTAPDAYRAARKCANYLPPPPHALREQLGARAPRFSYVAEAYPASEAVMLRAAAGDGDDAAQLEPVLARFGLPPGWARDPRLMRQTYNARVETVALKPSFRSAWRRRQFCLIPMQAFYEPSYDSGQPVRWRIERGDGAPFCVAGLAAASRNNCRSRHGSSAQPGASGHDGRPVRRAAGRARGRGACTASRC